MSLHSAAPDCTFFPFSTLMLSTRPENAAVTVWPAMLSCRSDSCS